MNGKTTQMALDLSFENAERWLRDAQLLKEDGSYGHADALLRYAAEEGAKAYVCWLVCEGIIPQDSKVFRDVFKNHIAKNQLIAALLLPIRDKVTDENIFSWWYKIEPIPKMMESRREFCVYVGQGNDGKIHSPKEVGQIETVALLKDTERLLAYIKRIVKHSSVEYKEKFRKLMGSLPKLVWKTGFLSKDDLKLIEKVEGNE
jgi:AbiV family abortive infection protein